MNTKHPSSTSAHAQGNDEETLLAHWKCQERALRNVREDLSPASDTDPDAAAYRALFAALERESLPEPPTDFVKRTAAAAERFAEARRHVARFRKLLSGLLGLLYLPTMLLVAAMYIPKLWRAAPPSVSGEVSLGGWLIAIAALGILSLAIDRWRVDGAVEDDGTH
jgi:hypothetical protein